MSAYTVVPAEGLVKLDAMENPYRLPETLRREIGEAVADAEINRYPDPTAPALVKRLREVMGICPEYDILLGNGSDEIIHIIAQSVARPGAVALAPRPSFVMFSVYAQLAGLRYVGVLLNPDFTLDPDVFLRALAEHRPAVVFIAYPNNPTGNLFSEEAIATIVAAAPGLVVIDEAYHAFGRRTFMARLAEFPNLVIMRTLSKLGLAGIRLGYAGGRSGSANSTRCGPPTTSACSPTWSPSAFWRTTTCSTRRRAVSTRSASAWTASCASCPR